MNGEPHQVHPDEFREPTDRGTGEYRWDVLTAAATAPPTVTVAMNHVRSSAAAESRPSLHWCTMYARRVAAVPSAMTRITLWTRAQI